jgi:hypothetical protein
MEDTWRQASSTLSLRWQDLCLPAWSIPLDKPLRLVTRSNLKIYEFDPLEAAGFAQYPAYRVGPNYEIEEQCVSVINWVLA